MKIVFDNAARDADRLSALDRLVITDAANAAGVAFVIITSTARTPDEQARAMYQNCVAKGPGAERALYAAPGQKVVDVYVDCARRDLAPDGIVAAMVAKIIELGPQTVSHHCIESWSRLHVMDISSTRMPQDRRTAFETAIAADKRIARHFSPFTPGHGEPAFHLEIPQS